MLGLHLAWQELGRSQIQRHSAGVLACHGPMTDRQQESVKKVLFKFHAEVWILKHCLSRLSIFTVFTLNSPILCLCRASSPQITSWCFSPSTTSGSLTEHREYWEIFQHRIVHPESSPASQYPNTKTIPCVFSLEMLSWNANHSKRFCLESRTFSQLSDYHTLTWYKDVASWKQSLLFVVVVCFCRSEAV